MKFWFMYCNHTFEKLPDLFSPKKEIIKTAMACFKENAYGSLFVRDMHDETIGVVHGGKKESDVLEEEITKLINKAEEIFNLDCRT